MSEIVFLKINSESKNDCDGHIVWLDKKINKWIFCLWQLMGSPTTLQWGRLPIDP